MDFDFILPDATAQNEAEDRKLDEDILDSLKAFFSSSISEIFEDSPSSSSGPSTRPRSTSCPRGRTTPLGAQPPHQGGLPHKGKDSTAMATATARAGQLRNRQGLREGSVSKPKAIGGRQQQTGADTDSGGREPRQLRPTSPPGWGWESQNSSQAMDISVGTPSCSQQQSSTGSPNASLSSSPGGLLDVVSTMVHGFSTFGQTATKLLNTLDANFDEIFNPRDEASPSEASTASAEGHHLPAQHPLQPRRLQPGSLSSELSESASVSSSVRNHTLGGNGTAVVRPGYSEVHPEVVDARVAQRKEAGHSRNALVSTHCPILMTAVPRGKVSPSIALNHLRKGQTVKAIHQSPKLPSTRLVASIGGAKGESKGGAPRPGSGDAHMTELIQLRSEVARMCQEMEHLSQRNSQLVEENSKLQTGELDPVDLAVRMQLEKLLSEKRSLNEENSRLERENQSLHELLAYTTEHSGQLAAEAAALYLASPGLAPMFNSQVHGGEVYDSTGYQDQQGGYTQDYLPWGGDTSGSIYFEADSVFFSHRRTKSEPGAPTSPGAEEASPSGYQVITISNNARASTSQHQDPSPPLAATFTTTAASPSPFPSTTLTPHGAPTSAPGDITHRRSNSCGAVADCLSPLGGPSSGKVFNSPTQSPTKSGGRLFSPTHSSADRWLGSPPLSPPHSPPSHSPGMALPRHLALPVPVGGALIGQGPPHHGGAPVQRHTVGGSPRQTQSTPSTSVAEGAGVKFSDEVLEVESYYSNMFSPTRSATAPDWELLALGLTPSPRATASSTADGTKPRVTTSSTADGTKPPEPSSCTADGAKPPVTASSTADGATPPAQALKADEATLPATGIWEPMREYEGGAAPRASGATESVERPLKGGLACAGETDSCGASTVDEDWAPLMSYDNEEDLTASSSGAE